MTIDLRAFDAQPCLGLLAKEKALAVALSGGPDSMALAWLLARWAQKRKRPALHALTVDHGLRPESAAEAEQVGRWAREWPGVRHAVLRMKPPKGKTRLMENARHGRYALMADYCRKEKIRYLLLAHHLDDQAETFLFRLAKGSGLDGLGAMRAAQEFENGGITLIRPLLDIPKGDLVALCEKYKIPFVRDPTNENRAYARNRLRHAREVLEREGLSAKRLAVTASRLARAREALDTCAGKIFDAALKEKSKSRLVLDYAAVAAEPAEIRLRAIMMAAEGLAPGKRYGLPLEKMELLVYDLFAPGPFRRRTLGGLIFSLKKDNIYIERERKSSPRKHESGKSS